MFFILLFSAVPLLAMLFYRHPMWLLYLFPITTALFGVVFHEYHFWAGGFMLFPTDAVYLFTLTTLGLSAFLRPAAIAAALKENIFLTLFLALMALYVVFYTPLYGQSAIGEARKAYFILLIPLLAAVAIKTPADLRRFLLTIVWAAAGVAIVGMGTAVAAGSFHRPISAQGALFVALVALVMLIHRVQKIVLIGPVVDKALLALFFAVAILAGHRTVWLALGSGLLLMFWFYGRRQAILAKLLLAVGLMIGAGSIGSLFFPASAERLAGAFGGILNPREDATASWRIEGWQLHLERLVENGNLLFGEGLGSYSGFDSEGRNIISPHSAYIELILKFGLFGLFLYGLLALKFVRRALAVRNMLAYGPMKTWLEAGLLTFVAAHTFCSGYSFDPIMFMLFALTVSVWRLSMIPLESPAFRKHIQASSATMQAGIPPRRALRPPI